MTLTRTLGIGILGAVLASSLLWAEDFSAYRGLEFGMNVAAAAKAAGTDPSEAKLVHERPALIQEMEWRARSNNSADPVRDGFLHFFNGELSRIVVTYDRLRVEGMTEEDMIAAISGVYGLGTRPTAEIAYHSLYGETAAVIARWEDPEYSYNLVHSGDQLSFAMVLYSKVLDAQAQAAIVEALRLDKVEAPRTELARQRARDEAERLRLEEVRSVNKPNFRP
jgi:hypothetical protein